MSAHRTTTRLALSASSLAVLSLCCMTGCGDDADSQSFPGCGSDADCKGDRICIDGMCVDPDDDPSGERDASVAGGRSGSGGSGGSGGGGSGSMGLDNPELEAACISNCESRIAAECESEVFSLDQCTAQCIVLDEVGEGYCADEQGDQYSCLAAGGYTCSMGRAVPKSTCIPEGQALSQCSQTIPCHRYCDNNGDGCIGEGDDCFEACTAALAEMQESSLSCSFDYQRLLSCWTQNGGCADGEPTVEGCVEEVAEVAECLTREGECTGFCWAAELLGCGSGDCEANCQAKSDDSSCGYRYDAILRCAIDYRELNIACNGAIPEITEVCDSEVQEYQNCLASQ